MAKRDPLATATAHEDGTAPPRRGPWLLRVLHAPDPAMLGRSLVVGSGLVIGRDPGETGVRIEDAKLSRRHLQLLHDASCDLIELRDLDSKNGTFLDGIPARDQRLAGGEIIRAGGTLFELDRATDHDGATSRPDPDPELLGDSSAMLDLLRAIDRLAPTRLPVLVHGETGTGKELVARRMHRGSGRTGELVAINCAAVPATLVESTLFGVRRGAFTGAAVDSEGLVKRADGGTLFLDEIGELPLDVQPKLLRVLENGELLRVGDTRPGRVDLRIVSATHRDLLAEVDAGRFRADLYARVAGAVIEVPPLRNRRSDVVMLFIHFLRQAAPDRTHRLGAALLERLVLHPFAMNVRELRSVAQHVALVAEDDVEVRHLPATWRDGEATRGPAEKPTGAPGREELGELLRRHRGNVAEIAAELGKERRQIYRWLHRHGLSPEDYR